jgi:hypothetical protein
MCIFTQIRWMTQMHAHQQPAVLYPAGRATACLLYSICATAARMSFLEMSVNDPDRTPPRTPSAAAAPPPPPSSTTELSAFARAFVEALLASASLAFVATSVFSRSLDSRH